MPPTKKTKKSKPPNFGPTKRVQHAYEQGIKQITGRVLTPMRPAQTLDEWLAELEARSQAKDVQDASELLAKRMCKWINLGNAKTWREAASRTMQSQKLHRALTHELQGRVGQVFNDLVAQNAKYISSVAPEAAKHLVHEVQTAQTNGARAGTIAKMMRKRFPELTRSRVHLIARTETAKTSLALTQARCEDIGAKFAEWATSEDVRVRDSHRKMDKVVFAWDDLPSPEALNGEKSTLGHYGPGGCPNCRCVVLPILSADDITWPRRVHHHGSVQQMNKQEFLTTFGLRGSEL